MRNWRESDRARMEMQPHKATGAYAPTLTGRVRYPYGATAPALGRCASRIEPGIGESCLPPAPRARATHRGRARRMRPLLLTLTVVGIIGPADLSVLNWYIGGPVHTALADIITRYLIYFSFILAIVALPVLLIVTALQIWQGKMARMRVVTPTDAKAITDMSDSNRAPRRAGDKRR